MRRNHQNIPQKRGYTHYVTRMKQKTKKRFCFKQKSQKPEENSQLAEMTTWKTWKIKKEIFSNIMYALLITAVVLIVGISIFIEEAEDKDDNVISRHYTEILKDMDDEPEDISLYKYQANVPKMVQKDIDKMLEMGEDASIVYHNDDGDKMIIEPSEDGYKVRFKRATNERYDLFEDDEREDNISFYKTKDTLVIYSGFVGRMLERYHMNNEDIEFDILDNKYVDLYGTNVKYDDIREFGNYFTLIRKGAEFSFYHLGEKVYTTTFPGGEISDWSYDYLTTMDKDCYNVYYSENPQEPWIKFCKVIENVDEILEDERITILDEEENEMDFPTFKVGNKKYAQIPNPVAERTYGQNYGRNRDERNSEINFTAELVEISALNSFKVKLEYKKGELDSRSEWILYYYFQAGDRECFFRKRINGLDSKISKLIPEEKIKEFDGKVFYAEKGYIFDGKLINHAEMVEKQINQLRLLYDEYTDNKL